jgi:hypothetical protein
MRIFIGGVACVGKTSTGAMLAGLLKWQFFDLDAETERFFGSSIERLQNSHFAPHEFRRQVAMALQHVLSLRIPAKPPTDSGINPPGDSGDKSPTDSGIISPGGAGACWL